MMFVAKLLLAMATFFIVLSYISKPINNECQMTFMMEPPKFIPVPIDEHRSQTVGDNQQDDAQDNRNHYALFMYSEYGFPMESDIRRDLKDSMPVLFVPGNAGSYQQVRSIASTCIRRQLQSLDAFKFIFYTIDFKAQLSGISGHLVNQQIYFVNSALNKISKIHSMDTNGVIVIGHSVGGFIAKALLARNDFNHNLVPLLINLASPLTKSFVNFDDEMRQLFINTNTYWSHRTNLSDTLAISISGGKLDRLVPTHLSLDPQYDLSLTTSSMKDVWLTTDHVSITWCRELMQKLSQLLSALMDKKQTRLIEDKQQALDIIENELQTKGVNYENVDDHVLKGQRIISTRNIDEFTNYRIIKRNELLEMNMVLNSTTAKFGNLLIWVEYIDTLKESSLYACENVQINNDQLYCEGRLNLMKVTQIIPSRRFEPKKKVVMLENESRHFKYFGIEFATRSKNEIRSNQVPESISLQVIRTQDIQILSIPTLPQYIFRKILSPSLLTIDIIVPNKTPLTYAKLQITDLIQMHQFYSLTISTELCNSSDGPSGTLVSLLQGVHLSESFHPDKTTQTVIARLSPRKTILTNRRGKTSSEEIFLDLFLDGTCETRIKIEFDWWSYIENIIQERSAEILGCASYSAYASIVTQLLSYFGDDRKSARSNLSVWTYWSSGYMFAYVTSTLDLESITHLTDHIVMFSSIFMLSNGLVALIENIIKRVMDVGIVAYKFSILLRKTISTRVRFVRLARSNGATNSRNAHKDYCVSYNRSTSLDIEWLIICLTIVTSTVFSEALMRFCMIFIITMMNLRLVSVAVKDDGSQIRNEHLRDVEMDSVCAHLHNRQNTLYCSLISIATLCALSLIGNIPALLLKLSSLDLDPIGGLFKLNFLTTIASLALVKIICDHIESQSKTCKTHLYQPLHLLAYLPRHSHLLVLLPISTITDNICNMSSVEFVTMVWAASILIRENIALIEKAKKD